MHDFQESLSHFFRAATAICDEVLEFRPDLVMGLMHSASLPLYAGMELWKQTQDVPFPPTVKVNLGREKLSRHDEMEDRPGFAGTFIGDYEGLEGKAFFLAWLSEPTQWHEELIDMVREVVGDTRPRRILIVDEFIHEGSTYLLTLGLLHFVYPQAELRFYNADLSFTHAFLIEWARRCHPGLLETALSPHKQYPAPFGPHGSNASSMVLGTEDIDPESLRWKTVDLASAKLQDLQEYLPASDWLELPVFARQVVLQEIAAHVNDYRPAPPRARKWYPTLPTGAWVLREIYRFGPLTVKEISRYLGWSIGKTRSQVEYQIGQKSLVVERHGRVKKLALPPQTGSDDAYLPDRPMEAYWVIPNQLMAGELPGFDLDADRERLASRIQWLRDMGITCFIDLSPMYKDRPKTYDDLLVHQLSEGKQAVHYVAIPTPMRRLPPVQKIRAILDELEKALTCGHVVYIHDHHNDVTDVILGCYLVQQGSSGTEAMQWLEKLRSGLRDGWRRVPVKESYRRLVRRWKDLALVEREL